MFRYERFLLYGTVLLLLCVLTNILVISKITNTPTHSLPENLINTTKSQNIPKNFNSTISKNVPENFNNTISQNVSENSNNTISQSTSVNTTESKTNTTIKIIQSITDPKIYNKNFRPNYEENAVEVIVRITVHDIITVSDYTNELTVKLDVGQLWYDPRLQFTPIHNVTYLFLLRDFAKLVWLPDTTIENSKSLSMQLTDSALASASIVVGNDGHVYYKNTFTTTVNCPMDLEYFPIDQQICQLDFGSWFSDKLIAKFRFKRVLGYYINQIYVPSFMIVVISWIPFWLNRNDHYARVGLGVTTVLTITTMVISINESLPKTSYLKAIDVYLFVCFLMVFLAMVEFAMIGFFEFEEQSYTLMKAKEEEDPVTNKADDKVDKSKSPKTKRRNTAQIDKVSRVLFPTVFITFNLIYVGALYYISNNSYSHLDNFTKYDVNSGNL